MSFEHAAALPVNYLTAHIMINEIARVRSGDSILIHAAAGGVGTAALQLCRAIGGVTVYGTASKAKHEYVRKHGCDHPIDYKAQDYAEVVKEASKGKGVRFVLDPLGGDDFKKGYDLLEPGGILIAFGVANFNKGGKRRLFHVLGELMKMPKFGAISLMQDNRGVAGVNLGALWDHVPMLRSHLLRLLELYDQGAIEPHIHRVYPIEQAAEAHAELEYGRNVGKVLIAP